MIVGEEEMVISDENRERNYDLETPVQSPEAKTKYEVVQTIDTSAISTTTTTKPTSIEIDKCDGFLFTCSHCDFYAEDQISYTEHLKEHSENINNCNAIHS